MITAQFPLTDIHRHLDGNIRASTILDLGRAFNCGLPANDIESLRPHVQVMSSEPDLVSFLQKLDWALKYLAIWTRVAVLLTRISRMRCEQALIIQNYASRLVIWL